MFQDKMHCLNLSKTKNTGHTLKCGETDKRGDKMQKLKKRKGKGKGLRKKINWLSDWC